MFVRLGDSSTSYSRSMIGALGEVLCPDDRLKFLVVNLGTVMLRDKRSQSTNLITIHTHKSLQLLNMLDLCRADE
jgi:hypothetical protein